MLIFNIKGEENYICIYVYIIYRGLYRGNSGGIYCLCGWTEGINCVYSVYVLCC